MTAQRVGEQAQRGSAMPVPMRRIGTTSEVADAVLWLCSERSSFVNGTVLTINGGRSAGTKPPSMMPG